LNPRNDKGTWRERRRIIRITLALCAAEIVYLTVWGGDTKLNDTLATGTFILAGSVIGSYVFGAAWEDIRMKQADTYATYGPYPGAPLDDRPR
jgi:hypothetical protein